MILPPVRPLCLVLKCEHKGQARGKISIYSCPQGIILIITGHELQACWSFKTQM